MKKYDVAKLPPIDAAKSLDDWDAFYRRAEPTRAVCAKIMAQRAEGVIVVDKPISDKVISKPKKK